MNLRLSTSLVVFLLSLSLQVPKACSYEENFFSYKRFFLNQGLVDKIPSDGKTQTDINKFAQNYTDGLYSMSGGRLPEAEAYFLEARRFWPEYFATDFLLALVYEEKDDYKIAARFYKSYLRKLKGFYSGTYRISAPLIRSLSSFEIESYAAARQLVEKRLGRYGISLDRVRPVATIPDFLFSGIGLIVLVCVYIAWRKVARPFLEKRHNIKYPPEGFWVCRHCGAYNPDLSKECEKCGKMHHE